MLPTRERLFQPFVFVILMILIHPARGQQQSAASRTGTIQGTVVDSRGAALWHARVEVKNFESKRVSAVETDSSGRFYAIGLVSGSYTVKVQAAGFRTAIREPLHLDASQTAVADFRLEVGSGPVPDTATSNGVLTDGRGTWELGVFLGGGTGAGKSSDTQFFYVGGRGGLVFTPDLFAGTPVRGNLEYAAEIMPVYTVFTPNGAVYGASIKPFLVQWNFTKPRRLVPFVHIAGGVLFTTSDVPPPDTSSINFTPQIGGGVHWFRRTDRSVDFSVDVVHHSNASLGDHNPGYNASVFFTVGYSWFKPRKR
jgi:hypothetical protein